MWGITRFIGIWGYKKGYLVKIWLFILKICIGRGVQQKYFGRYSIISIEIRCIL
jgi:hypothetical protein